MPKAKKGKAPAQPVAPTPPPEPKAAPPPPAPPGLAVVYHELEILEFSTAVPRGPLTIADCEEALGWETEKQYQIRKVAEKPGTKPEQWLYGEVYHCKNLAGEKVRCRYNANNRPFDMDWCEHLIHTVLYGQWAGPFTIPGETVNGETVRISKYGRVLSGQHQMTACKLAGEWLARARANGTDTPEHPKYPVWVGHPEPFIETIMIRGLSEDPRVLMTIDYVKPRTAADVFYTSDVFKTKTPPERKDLCRMLAAAVDLLWTRTDTRGYRTHPEIVAFLERHLRLLKCVEHIDAENDPDAGKKLTRLRLQPGVCAAIMYIQASSGPATDGDVYRNEEPPSEKHLDWSLWDRAEEFWSLLAGGKDFQPVRDALGRLVDSTPGNEENQGLGGRTPEKLAILAKAWERWRDYSGKGPVFTNNDLSPGGDLCLNYSTLDDKGNVLPDGQVKLLDPNDFYGIDCPESVGKGSTSRGAPMPPAPTREEIERATEEARARRKGGTGGK